MKKATLLLLALALSTPAFADELDEPGRLAAVQQRRFRLDHELFTSASVLPWDAFYKGVGPSGSYTVHFTDSFGWEVVRGSYAFPFHTSLRQQLEDFGVEPTRFDEIRLMLSSSLMLTPFYGKFSLLNRKVMHGEFFGLMGGTLATFTNTESTVFKPGPQVGLGTRLFLNEWISVRGEARYHFLVGTKFTHVVDITAGLAFNFGGAD